jgi:hypothetical protein
VSSQRVAGDYDKFVDKYGQFAGADWPGKVHGDQDLQDQRMAEEADLRSHPAPSDRDAWGGLNDGPQLRATGYFRTELQGGKWWLVDPDGRLFLSVGMNAVTSSAPTVVSGRESLFSWLPSPGDPLSAYYGQSTWQSVPGPMYYGKTYNFFGANLARQYGENPTERVNADMISRLKSWGFNTVGNWSWGCDAKASKFPYVVTASTSGHRPSVPLGTGGARMMPDVFDPAFAATVDENVEKASATVKDDPALLGYFVDNELPWGPGWDAERRYGVAEGALSLGKDSAAKRALVAQLEEKYGSIDKLNAAWNSAVPSPIGTSIPWRKRSSDAILITCTWDAASRNGLRSAKRHARSTAM